MAGRRKNELETRVLSRDLGWYFKLFDSDIRHSTSFRYLFPFYYEKAVGKTSCSSFWAKIWGDLFGDPS